MPQSSPYQPVLLRITHGAIASLTVLALGSGFWVYNTYDKRWGGLPLPKLSSIQDIHGTIAVIFLLMLPIFVLYSFHLGYRRLIQERSVAQLKQFGTPGWWISIHHFTNTFMLFSATFAALTGRMMKEAWLPAGELYHQAYTAHLVAWVGVLMGLALHLLLGVKVGGIPLLLSMFNWKKRHKDKPQSWFQGIRIKQSDLALKIVEVVVIGGIIMAFIIPLFNA
ncbi:MAG: cytochrome b/b6 domain-containing protein [Alkalinema sp. RU_4_3]|nr:cytochrome b/b6 domain-containing protein [Alkalinema sp. RU_4_3]